MKYEKFIIKNFKGVEDVEINLNRSPDANIYSLIGLNESGKTTILEAINLFTPKNEGLNALDLPGATIEDYNNLIPISKRDNFNGTVSLEVDISIDDEDFKSISQFTRRKTVYKILEKVDKLTYYKNYNFKNSKFVNLKSTWTGLSGKLSVNDKDFVRITGEPNILISNFCKTLIPSILYFRNFLFDFPSKIYLKSDIIEKEKNFKQEFYSELIQDILFSLDNNTNIKTHIIDRYEGSLLDKNDSRNLDILLKKMNKKVTDTVFNAWNEIFKREIKDTEVLIKCGSDEKGIYLEFEIESSDGIYQINERSLGFRWFFTFLLFTQFRPFRKDSPKNVIFLFDEPASNLHSTAQKQLLKSFENLITNCKIIYTTHSHHLINSNWLESTYVVKNEGLNLDTPEIYNSDSTKISISTYRDFATNHPHNTAYFQPILDVLDYTPSNLELIPNCIFIEGKNDFYTLTYFNEVIFNKKYDLNMAPSTGSGNLDSLISLYMGWGKSFIILLDSDRAGNTQKDRYIEKFGIFLEDKTFVLSDIEDSWDGFELEKIFKFDDLLLFQKSKFPNSDKFLKKQFNRAIQENLMSKIIFEFSDQTKQNVDALLKFIENNINRVKKKN